MPQQRPSLDEIFGTTKRPSLDEVMELVPPPNIDAAGRNATRKLTDAYGKYVSGPLDQFAQRLRSLDTSSSVMDRPGDGKGLKRILAPMAAGAAEVVAHPAENAPTILGLAAQFNPWTRAIMGGARMAQATPAVRGLTQMLMNTGAAGVGGGVGGFVKDGPEGVVPGAQSQAAIQASGEGLMLGAGLGLRGLGRGMGYAAMLPSKAERAAIWMGEKGTSRGFTPGRGRRLTKDLMFERGDGSITGDTYVKSIEQRLATANADNDAIVAATRGQFPEPSPAQFNINIPDTARGVRNFGERRGTVGGLTPAADQDAILATLEQYLDRNAGSARPKTAGLLTEGTRKVPVVPSAETADELGSYALSRRPAMVPDESVPPTFLDTPYADEYGPLPHQPLIASHKTQGTMPPPGGRWGDASAGATIERPGIEVSPRQPVLPRQMDDATFEEALAILRNVDKDLTETMQKKVGSATGRSERYVPSPAEEAGMQLRGNLRADINAKAPVAPSGRTMEDANAEITRSMPWLRAASGATDEAGGLNAAGTVGRGGLRLSLTNLLQQLSGGLARPVHTAGVTAAKRAGESTQLAHLLALLMAPSHPRNERR